MRWRPRSTLFDRLLLLLLWAVSLVWAVIARYIVLRRMFGWARPLSRRRRWLKRFWQGEL